MAPPKCVYFKCHNKANEKSMFRFPSNDRNRLQLWLTNCGNMTITHLHTDELRNKYICIDHFEREYIKNEHGKRKRISKDAIPMHYNQETKSPVLLSAPSTSKDQEASPELKVLTPKKVYGRNKNTTPEKDSSEENFLEFGTPKSRKRVSDCYDTPKCKKLKMSIKKTTEVLRKEKNKHNRLRRKVFDDNVINVNKFKFKSETSKILTLMQLKKSKTQWTEKEKKFCLSLYYKSPSAYKHLLGSGVVLAAPSTIQNWLQETNCFPGLNDDVLYNVAEKFNGKCLKDRACTICFDEMAIMSNLEYSKKYDLIEGFEDFGDNERANLEAKYALVFVARGIYTNWKMPLAYFLAGKNVGSDKLVTLIKNIINKLFDSNLLPKAIICDQATTNVKAMKMLGATKDDPYFFVNSRKIFSIFDVPHLIKNIRNNLLGNNFLLNGAEISFQDIIKVYNLEKNNKSRSLRKLSPIHMNPNSFQKMKVSLATQIFSNSVAASINTAIQSGELISNTAQNTANFVQLINDVFDALNSKNKFDRNPYRCAMTKNENSRVRQKLSLAKFTFQNLKKVSKDKKGENKFTIPPCFDGMQQTINAILQLSSEEFSSGTGINFLITYRFNQDIIENLFGLYRMKGGCNRNPTAKGLRAMYRSQLLNNLIKLKNTNCEQDDDVFVNSEKKESQAGNTEPIPSTSLSIQNEPSEFPEVIQIDTPFVENVTSDPSGCTEEPEITLEKCSVVYFAGWIAKNCTEKFDCDECKVKLLNSDVDLHDKSQLLLINKTYSNIPVPTLKSPTDFLCNLVDKALSVFEMYVEKNCFKQNISMIFRKVLEKEIIVTNFHDDNHLNYLINKIFEVKMHDYCKRRKKSLGASKKVRILQHK